MRNLPVIAAVGLALLISAVADAADPGSAPERPGPPTLVRPSGPPIVLEASKGTLIRLSGPANTVFIANPEIADVTIKTPSLIYLIAKSPGETVLYAVDSEDRVLLNAPVRVEHDLSRVRNTLSSVAPGENVAVAAVDNSLVLSGNVSSAGRAERVRSIAASIAGETKGTVVNRMAVTTPNQVSIRVKVAEVNRTALKALGVNLVKPFGKTQFHTENPFTGGQITAQNVLTTILGGNAGAVAATFDDLAQEGFITTLAEPNLTATNGQPASF